MRRLILLSAVLAFFVMTNRSEAGWNEFWAQFKTDFHRNHAWPEPFNHMDQQATANPIIVMKNNGWRLHNTVSSQLFNEETNELTRAGEIKVHWILTQAPFQRRTVYVLKGKTQEQTDQRMQAVELAAHKFVPEGTAQIQLTEIEPSGASGDYFDQVDRKVRSTIPEPRLPAMSTGDGN